MNAVSGAWRTYRNEQAGYTVCHPAAWSVDERTGADGSLATTFGAPDGGAGIEVVASAGDAAGPVTDDLPNRRCQPVAVGGVPGVRCFDTLSFSTTTTLAARGKTYVIATASRRLDQATYDHFLATLVAPQGTVDERLS